MTNQNFSSVLQRIAARDESAVDECLKEYGGMVWALSKKFTDCETKAETLAEKIFADIWNCADCFDLKESNEKDFILYVALKNLFGRLLSIEKVISPEKPLEKAHQKLSSETIKALHTFLYVKKMRFLQAVVYNEKNPKAVFPDFFKFV